MNLLFLVLWIAMGIMTVARVVATSDDSPDGPVTNFIDSIAQKNNDTLFVGVLIGMAIVSVILWPLVIIYKFIKSTKQSNKIETAN